MSSHKSRKPERLATYCRSYLVTLGLTFISLALYFSRGNLNDVASWPLLSLAFFATLVIGGLALIWLGLTGPTSKMEAWAEVTARHEATVLIMALAYPVYLALAPFYEQR